MVIRIHNVGKWSVIPPGQILQLSGQGERRVRVEFNCPAPTRLDLIEGDKGTFLAVVQGYEVVEFLAHEDAYVSATSEDEVWYFTNDGQQTAVDLPEAVSLTKIANRRARNRELELMMFKMEQNMNRRTAALEAELLAMRDAMPAHDPETGEIEDERHDDDGDGEEDDDDPGVADAAAGSPDGGDGGTGSGGVPKKGKGGDNGAGTGS